MTPNGHDQMLAEYVCGTIMVETYYDTYKLKGIAIRVCGSSI